jgi:hypothetical protein
VITTVVQRWRARRDSYRPAGEVVDTRHLEVAKIDELPARAFVEAHHYSGSYPASRFRFALHQCNELVGVAVFSEPCSPAVLTKVFPTDEATELGRFVLLDGVGANAETWFLARAFELLRRDVAGVVSFSDPIARTNADGVVVFPGHVGTIYQAFNGVYLGRATPRTLRLLPDGRVFSDRTMQKIRAGERGWRYGVEQLIEAGAPAPTTSDLRAWLRDVLPRVTRTMRHQGNHRYAWGLERAARRAVDAAVSRLPAKLAYPKFSASPIARAA